MRAGLPLTWSLRSLLGGRVLPLVGHGRGVEDPGGGAVLAKVLFQTLNGAVQLRGTHLEVHRHEVCRQRRKEREGDSLWDHGFCWGLFREGMGGGGYSLLFLSAVIHVLPTVATCVVLSCKESTFDSERKRNVRLHRLQKRNYPE